jgi:hypothetical protein
VALSRLWRIQRADPGGTASYNGFLLTVTRRAARGVTVNMPGWTTFRRHRLVMARQYAPDDILINSGPERQIDLFGDMRILVKYAFPFILPPPSPQGNLPVPGSMALLTRRSPACSLYTTRRGSG